MNKKNIRKTWHQPWSYREGAIITSGINGLGFALQAASDGGKFSLAGFPWNLLSGLAFLVLLIVVYRFFKQTSLLKWLGSVKAALPAIFGFTFLVLLMGFVKQDVEPQTAVSRIFGLTHIVHTWPFILINLYLLVLLGIVTMKRLSPLSWKNFGFFLNHFGLFLVLFSTALGSTDMQRLTMECYEKQAESRATNSAGQTSEMPFAIQLLEFNIDEFRPKLSIIDNSSGEILEQNGKSQYELPDQKATDILNYRVENEQFLATSWKVGDAYSAVNEPGAAPSAKVKVTDKNDGHVVSGWICAGSYMLQPQTLKLDDSYSLAMLPPEPRKFSSELNIQTKSGKNVNTIIEVNRPYHLDGWTIYQLGYNTEMGRWSNLSVLELVRDPWLPVVYFGIFMMMAGAAFLFITGKPKNGGTEHVA